MTIIVATSTMMVADSFEFWANLGGPIAPSATKIARAPDGSLVGCAGRSIDCHLMHEWVKAGMDFGNPPAFVFELDKNLDNDNSIDWIWLKTDGTIWRGLHTLQVHPLASPGSVGVGTACTFAYGAMAAGANVVRAVELAIQHCNGVGGELQIEKLQPSLADSLAHAVSQRPVIGGLRIADEYLARHAL